MGGCKSKGGTPSGMASAWHLHAPQLPVGAGTGCPLISLLPGKEEEGALSHPTCWVLFLHAVSLSASDVASVLEECSHFLNV